MSNTGKSNWSWFLKVLEHDQKSTTNIWYSNLLHLQEASFSSLKLCQKYAINISSVLYWLKQVQCFSDWHLFPYRINLHKRAFWVWWWSSHIHYIIITYFFKNTSISKKRMCRLSLIILILQIFLDFYIWYRIASIIFMTCGSISFGILASTMTYISPVFQSLVLHFPEILNFVHGFVPAFTLIERFFQ